MTTQQVATQLWKYCKEGKWKQAHKELYAKNVWSQEPQGASPRLVKGQKGIQQKGEWWTKNVKVHGMQVSKPTVAGNWITMKMSMDTQNKAKGSPRVKSEEICMYNVQDGKIVSEQFFYDMEG